MKPVRIHPVAEAELEEAVAWYEEKCPGLGLDLLSKVQTAFARVQRSPERWPRFKQTEFRKVRVERFPYLVFFLELPPVIWIIAVAHGSRRSGYWLRRPVPDAP